MCYMATCVVRLCWIMEQGSGTCALLVRVMFPLEKIAIQYFRQAAKNHQTDTIAFHGEIF